MKVLLLGSGGREHAMAWKLSGSPLLDTLYLALGNPGMADLGYFTDLNPLDFEGIKKFCAEHHIDLIISGPEAALAAGLKESVQNEQTYVLGPGKKGAQLESSKAFAKAFMLKHGIPTAAYRAFVATEILEAKSYIQSHPLPIVLKADGLAAGKGVVICSTTEHALQVCEEMLLKNTYGSAGSKMVVESFLTGIEVSVFILTDGTSYVLLPEAKDYKKIGVGDTGPNTGGMGAVSPVPFFTPEFREKVEAQIIKPTLRGLAADSIPYDGFIFFGLINVNGDPFVIEYNVRLGDPETQAVLPRLESDLLEMITKVQKGGLSDFAPQFIEDACATVVCVSEGYPGTYSTGLSITGTEHTEGSLLFHAGTKIVEDELVTAGGRVLSVTSLGDTLEEAVAISLLNAEEIKYTGRYYRNDIGKDLMIE